MTSGPTRASRVIRLVGAVFLAASAAAQAQSVDERLQKLEQEVNALRDENRQLRSELGVDQKGSTVQPNGHETVLSVGGMLQVQSEFGDKGDARFTTGNDRIYLRRARMNVAGRFGNDFEFKVEGEFAGSLAETSGYRSQLTDGYFGWTHFDFANVRVGQFKTPFGFEQLMSDAKLFTIERSLMNDRLTVGRQIGAQLSGDAAAKRFSYAIGVFNGSGVNTNANDNEKFMTAGRVSAVLWQGAVAGKDTRWSVGANAFTTKDTALTGQPPEFGFDLVPGGTKDNTFAGSRRVGGVDSQLHVGPFDLMGEYLRGRYQPADRIPAGSFEADGWYLQAAWFVLPKTLQAAVKYESFDPNLSATANRTRTWTLGGNWFIKGDDIRLQVDYLIIDLDGAPTKDNKLLMRLQTVF